MQKFRNLILLSPLAYVIHHFEEHIVFNFREWRLSYFLDNNSLSTEEVLLRLLAVLLIMIFLHAIKRDKPVLLVEIEKQYTKKEVAESINFINSLGYKSYFFNKKDLKSTTELNNLDLFNNFIFFPK